MGTRSTVAFYSEWDKSEDAKPIVNIYQQFDGYITGVGHELANFLKEFTVINGIGMGQDEMGKYANGMNCLAAQFIRQFKERVGGLYLAYPDEREGYHYDVRLNKEGNLTVTIGSYHESIDGKTFTPEELLELTDDHEE